MDQPLTIAAAAADLRAKRVTSVELTEAALERIHQLDGKLGAFIVVTGEQAMAMARRADADFAAGVDHGPLQGIPFALKDILATKDAPTTANSRVLDRAWGEGYDCVVAERVRKTGAVLLGKLVLWEFALGQPDPEKGFPIPLNPWNLDCTPGGSSSGTGIAVAAGMVLGGLGTDTGGSVRHPSARNNVTGLKVTYGRVPKWGCVPLGYSLDTIGPMARTAFDCALILNEIAGYDPRDPTSSATPVEDYVAGIDGSIQGLKVGVPTEYFYDHPMIEPEVKAATLGVVEVLRSLGAQVAEVNLPLSSLAGAAISVTLASEAFSYHRVDLAGPKWRHYGAQTRMAIGRGALYTAADYVQAQRFRSWYCREAAKVMGQVDVLVAPVTIDVSPPNVEDPARRRAQMSPRSPFNLLGYPSLAVPSGFASNGMPVSSQIVGAPFAEALVLRVGHALQQATDWHMKVPSMVEEASRQAHEGTAVHAIAAPAAHPAATRRRKHAPSSLS